MRWWRLGCALMLACSSAATAAATTRARSEDGRWQVVAEGPTITVYDQGVRVKLLTGAALDGRDRSAVAAIHYLPARRSFVIAFETLPELWELSIDPQAAPIFDGLVHDYRSGEGLAGPGYLGARRTRLEAPLRELAFDDSGAYVIGRSATAAGSPAELQLVQLDVRRAIGRFSVGGEPDLATAKTLTQAGRTVLRIADRLGAAPIMVELLRARLIVPDRELAPGP